LFKPSYSCGLRHFDLAGSPFLSLSCVLN
jgi:hypothetical protein